MTHRTTPLVLLFALAACGPNLTHPPHMPYTSDGGTLPPLTCVPNLDGMIEASELAPGYGVPAHFLVSPAGEDRMVDLVGAPADTGALRWDLGTDYASDLVATFTAAHLADRWYAGSFPTGQFVVATDAGGATEGVYRLDADALRLLGLASTSPMPPEGETLLVYDEPIVVFQLPLVPGASWVSASDITNGTLRGLPYAGRDVYENSVVAAGEVVLPDLTFTQAMRVATHVTVSPSAGAPVSRRQSTFVFECFGEVARAVSHDGEPSDDFTVAAELRRFGL